MSAQLAALISLQPYLEHDLSNLQEEVILVAILSVPGSVSTDELKHMVLWLALPCFAFSCFIEMSYVTSPWVTIAFKISLVLKLLNVVILLFDLEPKKLFSTVQNESLLKNIIGKKEIFKK